MNLITDGLNLHESAARVRAQRLELLSANIANADTPNFKARDLDFKAAMSRAQADRLKSTNPGHQALGSTGPESGDPLYSIPFNASLDGNTVELAVEQAKYGKAAVDYRASLMFLENRVSTIKRALRGE